MEGVRHPAARQEQQYAGPTRLIQRRARQQLESRGVCKHNSPSFDQPRRGGRVVECTGLENQQGL